MSHHLSLLDRFLHAKVDTLTDDNGHGTHTSGSVAGDGSASDGEYAGMAPDADLTVYSTGLTLAIVNSIGAFDHLIDQQRAGKTEVQPVSNSYGPTSGNGQDFNLDSAMKVAIYNAFEAGILPLFFAGSSGPRTNTLSKYAKAPWSSASRRPTTRRRSRASRRAGANRATTA